MPDAPTILCLASFFKGERFLEAAARLGARVILVTTSRCEHEAWPREALAGFYVMPSLMDREAVTNAIGYLARQEPIARIVALDEYDTLMAAHLREHLRIGGAGESRARLFRDKLAMRHAAREADIAVPDFVGLVNRADAEDFARRTDAPFVLKPRMEASAMGIRKLHGPEHVAALFDELGDAHADYLLEAFVPGEVFHVDSVVWGGAVRFACASVYGTPPMQVYQGGGVFATRTLAPTSPDALALLDLNARLLRAFGMQAGVSHAEFIRGDDGTLYFLEVAARVGGAGIADLVEHARGVNLWEAWASVEIAAGSGEDLELPPPRDEHAGLLVCLARQAQPDLSGYDAPEVAWRMDKSQHAGLILRSPDPARIDDLLGDYLGRFADDFLTTAPPKSRAEL